VGHATERFVMRSISCVLVLVAASAALAQAPSPNVPYMLTISAPSARVVVGEPVWIQVTLENTSDSDVTIVKSRASELGELTYDVDVVTTNGARVQLTPYGRALHGEPATPPIVIQNSPHAFTLKPHQKFADTILLSKIYELTPGDYIVRVHKAQRPESGGKLFSNTLRLTILPN